MKIHYLMILIILASFLLPALYLRKTWRSRL